MVPLPSVPALGGQQRFQLEGLRAERLAIRRGPFGNQHFGQPDVARHGVASRTRRVTALSGSPADAIMDTALEEGSDLIVSGAYGHNRTREWIFGGFTGDLLDRSPVACLMSH